LYFAIDYKLYTDVVKLFRQLHNESKGQDTVNEALAASGHALNSSQVNTIVFIQANRI